jgi:hypothetical protein
LASWLVVGFAAGQILRAIGGDREGAKAMAGFFVIGPMGGVAGFALCFWLVHRYLGPGAPAPRGPAFGAMLLSLALVLGVGWGAASIVGIVMRPQAWADLEPGRKAALEFRVHVPEHLLAGKPVSTLVGLELKTYDDGTGDTVTPATWTETRSQGQVTLAGQVAIEHRPREQYFALRQGTDSFDIYAQIPPDMRRTGRWQDEIYVGSDPAVPIGDRVSFTCRYVPGPRSRP